jgi:hypothetical protein
MTDDAGRILDLSESLARERKRAESKRCKCAEMAEAKRPCMACHVRKFPGGSKGGDGSWSSDFAGPVGTVRL